jgi:hypothetical protein
VDMKRNIDICLIIHGGGSQVLQIDPHSRAGTGHHVHDIMSTAGLHCRNYMKMRSSGLPFHHFDQGAG